MLPLWSIMSVVSLPNYMSYTRTFNASFLKRIATTVIEYVRFFFKQGATIGFHDFPVHCSASEAVKYLIVIINMMCFMAFSGKTSNMVDLLLCERSYKNKKSLQKPFVKLSY